MTSELLTITPAAKVLGMRVDTLRRLTNEGKIRCFRKDSASSGYGDRAYSLADLEDYKARKLARLNAQIASMHGQTNQR